MLENAIKLSEKERIYHFPCGASIVLSNVSELVVRSSGNHRVKTSDGKLHIIAKGWIHIEITDTDWTI